MAAERPGVYFHVEFGVSWGPRRPCKNRQVTYMSRSLRDREQQFPRQLPPANTNYLAPNPRDQLSIQQLQHQQQLQQYPYQHYYYQPQPSQHRQPQRQRSDSSRSRRQDRLQSQSRPDLQSRQLRRSSRSTSRRPSHERGKSAPPPLNDSPWDDEPEPMAASALPITKRKPLASREPELRRTLTDVPSLPSLGLDHSQGIIWSLPTGFIDDPVDNGEGSSNQPANNRSNHPRRAQDDRERGRVREIESLAEALMTVDNGFEDQWWYQGPRLVNVPGEIKSPIVQGHRGSTASDSDYVYSAVTEGPVDHLHSPVSDGPGDHVYSAVTEVSVDQRSIQDPLQPVSPPSTMADLVSPMTQSGSPSSTYRYLSRSLTTRSDELHM